MKTNIENEVIYRLVDSIIGIGIMISFAIITLH